MAKADTPTQARIIILSAFLVSVLALILLGFECSYKGILNFDKASELGDFVAGITMPIITLASVYLIFITIQAQIEANKIQRESLETEKSYRKKKDIEDMVRNGIRDLKVEIDRLKYTDQMISIMGMNEKDHSGQNAIQILTRHLENKNGKVLYDPIILRFYEIISELSRMKESVSSAKLDQDSSIELHQRIRYFYVLNFALLLENIEGVYSKLDESFKEKRV